jgi:hypothetical protein
MTTLASGNTRPVVDSKRLSTARSINTKTSLPHTAFRSMILLLTRSEGPGPKSSVFGHERLCIRQWAKLDAPGSVVCFQVDIVGRRCCRRSLLVYCRRDGRTCAAAVVVGVAIVVIVTIIRSLITISIPIRPLKNWILVARGQGTFVKLSSRLAAD